MVTIDFPNQGKQTKAEKARNAELAKLYKVAAFPTLLLLDSGGRPYAEAEMIMKVDGHVEHLGALAKNRVKRDAGLAAAKNLSGLAKAKALKGALTNMELQQHHLSDFYKEEVAEIAKNDPEDKTGFTRLAKAHAEIGKLEDKMDKLFDEGNFDGMLAIVDGFIKTYQPDGKLLQQALAEKMYINEEKGDLAAAVVIADEIMKIDPKSEFGVDAKFIKAELLLDLAAEKKATGK